MKTSQKGINLIKNFEGCSLIAYQDSVGVWTIGYGHTNGVEKGQAITLSKAEEYLKADLVNFERGVNKYVKVKINQNQFDALVSFSYNLGLDTLQKSDLLKKLNKSDYVGASAEFLLWVYAGGKVLNGLVRRREAERELFDTKVIEEPEEKEMVDTVNVNIDGKEYKMNRILKDGKNYVCLSDFKQAGFDVGYNSDTKVPSFGISVINDVMSVGGVDREVKKIFKQEENFVRLRDLEELLNVVYDSKNKKVSIYKK